MSIIFDRKSLWRVYRKCCRGLEIIYMEYIRSKIDIKNEFFQKFTKKFKIILYFNKNESFD